jgi:photosystem II stability/assembly factor-like uncharacterized protein
MLRQTRALALAFVTTAAFGSLAAQDSEGTEFQRERAAYWALRYGYRSEQTSQVAQVRARLAQLRFSINAQTSPALGNWTPLGPGGFITGTGQPDAGRVDAISLDPVNANTVYLSSPTGGVWKSTSGGDNWTPLTDHVGSVNLSPVAVDPVNPRIVYAGCTDPGAACFLMRSVDGGTTWASTGTSGITFGCGGSYGSCALSQIYIDPATAGGTTNTVLLAAGLEGMFRSTDGGASWSSILDLPTYSIVALPSSPGILFAGALNFSNEVQSGLYRSTDNGRSWSLLPLGSLSLGGPLRFQLAVSPASPDAVWVLAAGGTANGFLGLWRWNNKSSQLTTLAAAGIDQFFGTQGSYDLAVVVDPTDSTRMLVGGVSLFRSTNGGATFHFQSVPFTHVDWHALVADPRSPGRVLGGNDGGIYTSTDFGLTWLSRNAGLAITQFYPGIALHPTDGTVVLGGSQDNGSLLANGTSLWTPLGIGDGGFAAINYQTPTVMWTTCQSQLCINRSSFSAVGLTMEQRASGISSTDRKLFIPPFVMDPVTPTTLYYGTYRLWQTKDDGLSWAAISPDLTGGPTLYGTISAIAVAPSNAQVIYVGTSDGNISVSRNGGVTYALANSSVLGSFVTKIGVDPQNPLRAVATASWMGRPHALLTTDGGTTWANISGNLPDAPLNAVVMIAGSPNQFFVGGDLGTFETVDGGLTWTSMSQGLPGVVVEDLVYNPAQQLLVAATYGRGMFQYSLVNPLAVLRGDVNRDGKVDAFDALLIQQALVGIAMPSGIKSLPAGDANCNNALDVADALIVLRAAVGLTTSGACVGTVR